MRQTDIDPQRSASFFSGRSPKSQDYNKESFAQLMPLLSLCHAAVPLFSVLRRHCLTKAGSMPTSPQHAAGHSDQRRNISARLDEAAIGERERERLGKRGWTP